VIGQTASFLTLQKSLESRIPLVSVYRSYRPHHALRHDTVNSSALMAVVMNILTIGATFACWCGVPVGHLQHFWFMLRACSRRHSSSSSPWCSDFRLTRRLLARSNEGGARRGHVARRVSGRVLITRVDCEFRSLCLALAMARSSVSARLREGTRLGVALRCSLTRRW